MSREHQRQSDERLVRKSLHSGDENFRRMHDADKYRQHGHAHKPHSCQSCPTPYVCERHVDVERRHDHRAYRHSHCGQTGTFKSNNHHLHTHPVSQDVIMCVPTGSVITPVIAATVNMAAPRGTYTGENTFAITSCVTVILKVQADVNLLIPSYGYCRIPQCTEFSQDVCQGVFDLPLFPT